MTVSIFYFFIEQRKAKKRARILNLLQVELKIIEHSMHLKPASLKIEKMWQHRTSSSCLKLQQVFHFEAESVLPTYRQILVLHNFTLIHKNIMGLGIRYHTRRVGNTEMKSKQATFKTGKIYVKSPVVFLLRSLSSSHVS